MNKILDWLSELDFRTFLALVASFSVPVGPAFFFGWTFGTSVYSLVTPYAPGVAGVAAALVGLMVAIGLESVGMLSGYNSIRAWNAAAYGEALLASMSLGVYVILGISGVEGTLFGLDVLQVTTVFLMTPTAYVQMAVHYSLNRKEKVEQVVAEDAAADRREQERVAHEDRLNREKLAHEEKLAQDQRDHAFKLAQLQAQKEAKIAGDAAAAQAKVQMAQVRAEARAAKSTVDTASTAVSTVHLPRYADEARQVHQQMNGVAFGRRTIEEVLTVGRTKATGILRAGVEMGLWRDAGNDKFIAIHD